MSFLNTTPFTLYSSWLPNLIEFSSKSAYISVCKDLTRIYLPLNERSIRIFITITSIIGTYIFPLKFSFSCGCRFLGSALYAQRVWDFVRSILRWFDTLKYNNYAFLQCTCWPYKYSCGYSMHEKSNHCCFFLLFFCSLWELNAQITFFPKCELLIFTLNFWTGCTLLIWAF